MNCRALLAMGLLLSGCESLGGGPKMTEIVTEPSGALVRVEGYGECTTPCTVAFDVPRTISIFKEGFKERRHQLEPGKSRVVFKLELVAPTTEVEKTELPKL